MKLRPYRDLCLVKLDTKETHAASGLIELPHACQDQPTTGVVLAVGNECTAVLPGERVVFGKWNGWEVYDQLTREIGHEPGRLWLMRPIADKTAPHVGADHIHCVIEED